MQGLGGVTVNLLGCDLELEEGLSQPRMIAEEEETKTSSAVVGYQIGLARRISSHRDSISRGESGSMPPTQPIGLLEHVKGRQDLLEKKQEWISRYHTRHTELHQCGRIMLQQIKVSLGIVWSFVRRFDEPQLYKRFIQTCNIIEGNGGVGSIREIHLVSSVPATSSVERLEILDDENHVISFRVLGGGHRLQNYSSVTSLHELEIDGRPGTLVLESYVVDIPDGNTREETHMFVDTVVRCNLKSLAQISEQQYSKECAAQQKLEKKQLQSP